VTLRVTGPHTYRGLCTTKTNHMGDDDVPEDIDFADGSDSETSTDSSDSEVEHVPTNAEVYFLY